MAPREPYAINGAANIDDETLRRLLANTVGSTTGVVTGMGLTAQSTADRSVNVAFGEFLLPVTETLTGDTGAVGPIFGWNDGLFRVDLAPADTTNPRVDTIVVRYVPGDKVIVIEPVMGTPAATPVAPTITTSTHPHTIILGDARVETDGLVTSAKITDRRTFAYMPGYDSGWITPPLLGAWVAFGAGTASPQYRKVGRMVMVKGSVRSGAAGSNIFALPPGFRPGAVNVGSPRWFPADASNAHGLVEVNATHVKHSVGSAASIFTLDGVHFLAEA